MKLERMKLESSGWNWKVTDEVGKFWLSLEWINEVGKLLLELEKSIEVGASQLEWQFSKFIYTFQFWPEIFNFARFIPTSLGSFQHKHKLSNFRLSNYTIPSWSKLKFKLIFSDFNIGNDTETRKLWMRRQISSNITWFMPRKIWKCNNQRNWWNFRDSMSSSDLSNEFNRSLHTNIEKWKNLLGGHFIHWHIVTYICHNVCLFISFPWS